MARFEGSIKEFHDYIGPRIRNKINTITKKARDARGGICQECGCKKQLESAHVHTNSRRSIIERILTAHILKGQISCDLKIIEGEIVQAHYPIEKNFRFLCSPCHKAYDKKHAVEKTRKAEKKKLSKIGRVGLWAKKPKQINHQIVSRFLALSKNGKSVGADNFEASCMDAIGLTKRQFRQNMASMKTEKGHAHGQVFIEKNGYISIYPEVLSEIIKEWPKDF